MKEAIFAGVDYFDRPVFKCEGTYYCLTNYLFGPVLPTQEQLDEAVAKEGVTIKGDDFDDEPSHIVSGVRLRMQR